MYTEPRNGRTWSEIQRRMSCGIDADRRERKRLWRWRRSWGGKDQTPFAVAANTTPFQNFRHQSCEAVAAAVTFRLQEIYEQLHAASVSVLTRSLVARPFGSFETVGTHNITMINDNCSATRPRHRS